MNCPAKQKIKGEFNEGQYFRNIQEKEKSMNKKKFLIFMCLAVAVTALFWGIDQTGAQSKAAAQPQKAVNAQPVMLAQADAQPQEAVKSPTSTGSDRLDNYLRMYGVTPEQRKAAAERAAAAREEKGISTLAAPAPGGTPDYFGIYPNYANSPLPTNTGVVISGGIRKFVDSLPGLGSANANNLGQYIPIAIKDTTTYPGSDYYQIGLNDYTQKLHSDLPATTKLRGYKDLAPGADGSNHYLGPLIIAQKDRPVRIKFSNLLGKGFAGNLFIPVDTTLMGAGEGALDNAGNPCDPTTSACANYTQNRAIIHLHGGVTPWISDGTPHQWITPAGDPTPYKKGASFMNVPDMVGPGKAIPNPSDGDGMGTLYYTNQQSNRLMFYHEHALGITRLGVYAGLAAGYLLTDPIEEDLISTKKVIPDLGGVYHYGIPLIIQDKTFVPPATQLAAEDPTWNLGGYGNLWFPHVYMTNQNPYDNSGASAMGRWDYGPWFWPPVTTAAGLIHGEVANPYFGQPNEPPMIPGIPNPSAVPEAFMDTPVVNGTAYPYVQVAPKAYRFRILNACNDRFLNLQLYYADTGGGGTGATATATVANGVVTNIFITNGGTGYSSAPAVNITGGGGEGATATADAVNGFVTAVFISNGGTGYTAAPIVTFAGGGVGGTGAAATASAANGSVTGFVLVSGGTGYTAAPGVYIWGGGGEGAAAKATVANGSVTGFVLTNPGTGYTTAPNVTIGSSTEVKMVNAAQNSGLPETWPTDGRAGGVPDPTTAGPAMIQIGTEGGFLPAPVVLPNTPIGYVYNRRDIVVLNVENKTLFLGPAERADVIIDFSGAPPGSKLILYNDAPAPVPAFDPRLDYYTGNPDQTSTGGAPPTLPGYGPNTRTIMQFQVAGTVAAPFNLAALQAAWPAAYAASQPAPIVPQVDYPAPYKAATDTYSRIQDTSLTFTPVGSTTPITQQMEPKAIQELFELDYGRMNATLGVELPFTNFNIQTTIPLGYIDPPTEILNPGETQIWKITHNGVDTHAIHFHLFNVQVINRVGWDGAIRPPDANELGWKETVKMNPLEDCIVALKPIMPSLPFGVPDSVRPLNVTQPIGSTIIVTDPTTGNPINVTNDLTNFGHEYVWHCHLLGHEENDMMRPIVFQAPAVPGAPTGVTATAGNAQATVSFTAPFSSGTSPITSYTVTANPGGRTATGAASPITLSGLTNCTTYTFTVTATNASGTGPASSPSNSVTITAAPGAPTGVTATAGNAQATVSFTAPAATGCGSLSYTVTANPGGRTASGAASPLTVTGLTNCTAYSFTVKATNGAGTSLASGLSNSVTPAGVPGAPTGVTATAGNTQATVSFTAPAASCGITSYTVTSSPGNITATGAASPLTVPGLTNGTAYTFTVKATNGAGTGPASSPSNSVTPVSQLPAAPTNLTFVSSTKNTITISWTNNATNALGLYVQNSSSATGPWKTIALLPANTTTYTDKGLFKNTTYWYRVQAYNLSGTSGSSNVVSGTTLP